MMGLRIRPILVAVAAACLLGSAVFWLPYHVPVTPTVSLSYVAGYSNRAAVVGFLLAGLAVAWFVRGRLGTCENSDSGLGASHLYVALPVTLALCAFRATLPLGVEALYFLDRIALASAGRHPYTGFEFPYGPLLLYPPVWVSRLLHLSMTLGYKVCWVSAWMLGTFLEWFVIRSLKMQFPHRVSLLWILLLMHLSANIWDEGLQYSFLRFFAAACLIAIVSKVWQRTLSWWTFVLAGVSAVLFAFGVSLEQGLGALAGITTLAVMLLHRNAWKPWKPMLLFAAGSGLVLYGYYRYGFFSNAVALAQVKGAYSFPLTPSPAVLLTLFAYVAGLCAAVLLRNDEQRSLSTIAFAAGGSAMLPAAFGRCDLGHLQLAMPLFIVGLAYVFALKKSKWWFFPASVVLLIPPFFLATSHRALTWNHPAPPVPAAFSSFSVASSNQVTPRAEMPVSRASDTGTCATRFRSPIVPLVLDVPLSHQCLDAGYFRGMMAVLTEETIAQQIQYLAAAPKEAILLEDRPLDSQFAPVEANLATLYASQFGIWLPKATHPPVMYQALIDYITAHYQPGPRTADGYRLWTVRF